MEGKKPGYDSGRPKEGEIDMDWGIFYGVGVGPGDPEMLTMKAARVLEEVDVLFIPKSAQEKRSLAYSIVKDTINKNWEIKELLLPMTRNREELEQHWQAGAEKVARVLREGRNAAFITLGDPTIYSTFTYLLKKLKGLEPQVKIEIIPGISSINFIAANLKQPLVEGEEDLVIVTGLRDKASLAGLIQQFDNVVVLKAGNQLDKLIEIVKESKMPLHYYFASRCGFPDAILSEEIDVIAQTQQDYLSTMIIKKAGEEKA